MTQQELSQRIHLVERDVLFVLRLIGGFLLIVLGLVGLLFPIMPDWILIVIGILLFDVHGKITGKIFTAVKWVFNKLPFSQKFRDKVSHFLAKLQVRLRWNK